MKYANIFRDRKATTFYPFALTVEGEGGPSARQLCGYMARKISTASSNALNLTGAWRYIIIARISNSFAKGVGESRLCYTSTPLHEHHMQQQGCMRADSKDDDLSNYKWLT